MPRPTSGPGSRRSTGTRRRTSKQENENPTAVEADLSNVSVEIADLEDFEGTTNILLHGPVGNGKTIFASGVDNATFLAADRGVVSAKQVGSKAGLIKAPDWQHFLAGVHLADEKLTPEDWLIVDTWTKAQQMYIRWLLQMRNAENSARDLDIPALPDHQKWQNAIKRWADHLIDITPCNTIFICNSMTKVNEEGDDVIMPLILGGKNQEVCEYICAQMDVILYIEELPSKPKEPVVRRIVAQPTVTSDGRRIVAKDHYGVLGRWQDVEEDDLAAMNDFAQMIRG